MPYCFCHGTINVKAQSKICCFHFYTSFFGFLYMSLNICLRDNLLKVWNSSCRRQLCVIVGMSKSNGIISNSNKLGEGGSCNKVKFTRNCHKINM